MPSITFSHVAQEGNEFVTVFHGGAAFGPADQTHPNFDKIVAACFASRVESIDPETVTPLFDIAQQIALTFQRLSDRVSVKGGTVLLDGDSVAGPLQEQILSFVEAGDDFKPLVNFYEKLLSNPLGDVRESVYGWLQGKLTITDDGDLIGYKSVSRRAPEWRTDEEFVFVPSRRGVGCVNGRDVSVTEYIEQVPGDVVEMARSKVLHDPSTDCGDGLHIGSHSYASGFSGETVMLVQFNPRDIVSVPHGPAHYGSGKLRVCRYTVLREVTDALVENVYETAKPDAPLDIAFEDEARDLKAGDRLIDADGDKGTVIVNGEGCFAIQYDDDLYEDEAIGDGEFELSLGCIYDGDGVERIHGLGGPTSPAARGRGRNAAQDDKGRFSGGRPGSQRSATTGRFS